MELFLLYLWLKLDTFISLAIGTAVFLGVICLFFGFITLLSGGEAWQELSENGRRWCLKRIPLIWIFSILIILVTPTQTQTAILVGGHFALKAVESPEAAKIASVLRKKANEMLDKELAK